MTPALKDMLIRIAKTVAFALVGTVIVQGATGITFDLSTAALSLAIIAALVGVQNLFISPDSTLGRSLSTFIQVFIGTWAATGFLFELAVITAAFSAAVGAVINLIIKTDPLR